MPYLGKSPQHGNYSKIDDFSGDFDGSDATHAIASNSIAITPVRPEALIISINGVIQEPVTDYTVSGTNITFTTAPASTDSFFGVVMGEQLAIGTPSDATVTSAKLSGDLTLPGKLTAAGDTAASDNASIGYTAAEGLILTGQGSSNDITIKNDADAVVAKVLTGTTNFELAANLVLASGQGIDFAATSDVTGISSELLDDYEEGLFVTTVTCTSSGSYTLNSAYDSLAYTKVGRVVHIQGGIVITGESSPSGTLKLGLPFTIVSLGDLGDRTESPFLLHLHGDGGIERAYLDFVEGRTYAEMANMQDNGVAEAITEARVDTAFTFYVNFSYIAA
jgi:hypothetical protein